LMFHRKDRRWWLSNKSLRQSRDNCNLQLRLNLEVVCRNHPVPWSWRENHS